MNRAITEESIDAPGVERVRLFVGARLVPRRRCSRGPRNTFVSRLSQVIGLT